MIELAIKNIARDLPTDSSLPRASPNVTLPALVAKMVYLGVFPEGDREIRAFCFFGTWPKLSPGTQKLAKTLTENPTRVRPATALEDFLGTGVMHARKKPTPCPSKSKPFDIVRGTENCLHFSLLPYTFAAYGSSKAILNCMISLKGRSLYKTRADSFATAADSGKLALMASPYAPEIARLSEQFPHHVGTARDITLQLYKSLEHPENKSLLDCYRASIMRFVDRHRVSFDVLPHYTALCLRSLDVRPEKKINPRLPLSFPEISIEEQISLDEVNSIYAYQETYDALLQRFPHHASLLRSVGPASKAAQSMQANRDWQLLHAYLDDLGQEAGVNTTLLRSYCTEKPPAAIDHAPLLERSFYIVPER